MTAHSSATRRSTSGSTPAFASSSTTPAWAAQAQAEISRLAAALGPLAVRLEHVGSTAVPGLAAKPILDLQLSLAAVEPRARYVGSLEGLGYLFVPDPELPDYHFFAMPPHRLRSHRCGSVAWIGFGCTPT